MAMEFKRRLPIPMEIREEMPLSAELTAKKQAFDAEVAKVFTGEDARKVLIIGPCSADREDSVLEYMNRLAKTAEEVKDKLIIIPRVYTNKPRTKGTGYKGRVGLYQVMPVTEAIQRLIMANGTALDIAEQARKEGVSDLRRSGLLKVKQGLTSLDEVLSSTNE